MNRAEVVEALRPLGLLYTNGIITLEQKNEFTKLVQESFNFDSAYFVLVEKIRRCRPKEQEKEPMFDYCLKQFENLTNTLTSERKNAQ